jgi:uncharacterized GH25 family protein
MKIPHRTTAKLAAGKLGRLVLLLPAATVLLYAHFTWVTASVSPLEVGKTAEVLIGHGHQFPASEEVIITEAAEVYAVAPSGRRTALAPKAQKPLLVAGYKVAETGMHRFVLAQDRGVRSWTTQGVQPGGKDKHPQARRSARVFRSAVSYALTPGAAYEKAKPLGLVFEMTGEVTGDQVVLTVLRESKPVAGVAIHLVGQARGGEALGKTGPDGRFNYAFTAGNKGPLLFAADYIEQAAPTANYERGEYATSLHFVR